MLQFSLMRLSVTTFDCRSEFALKNPVRIKILVFSMRSQCEWTSVSTVKPVYNGQSKIDKIKILMTNGSLIKVKSIAEFCNTFDLH